MRESAVLSMVLRLGRGAVRLFRNQVGHYETPEGRHITYGLCTGSSDVIGWRTVTVTPEMVGQRVAVFVAIECKSPTGKPTKEQLRFIASVQAAGGIAGICRSSEDAETLLLAGPNGAINAP